MNPSGAARSKENPSTAARSPSPFRGGFGQRASKAPLKGELSPKVTEGLFVLCPQLGQDLLVAGLPAGDPVKVAAGGFADRHALSSKGSADVAEIAFVLRSRSIFLGSQLRHIYFSPQISYSTDWRISVLGYRVPSISYIPTKCFFMMMV